jgi:hypothetical protein
LESWPALRNILTGAGDRQYGEGGSGVTETDWQTCEDPETMVRALAAECYQRELRIFAVGCLRRIWPLLSDACRAAVEASEQFAMGVIAESVLAAAVTRAEKETVSTFPGHAAPNAREYAASAAVDAASVWPRTVANVLAATSCAATAAGCRAAEADESHYDEVFETVRQTELANQAALLRVLIRFPRS